MENSNNNGNSRREFFSRAGQILGVALVAPSILSSTVFAEEKRRARPTEGGAAAGAAPTPAGAKKGGDNSKPMVDPKSDMAKGVNYVENKADMKKAELKTEKMGVKWDDQFCHNCNWYNPAGEKAGGKVGNCTILGGNNVKEKAWCNSWTKRS